MRLFWGPAKSDFSTLLPELPKNSFRSLLLLHCYTLKKSIQIRSDLTLACEDRSFLGPNAYVHSEHEFCTCISLKAISLAQCSPWGNESHLRVYQLYEALKKTYFKNPDPPVKWIKTLACNLCGPPVGISVRPTPAVDLLDSPQGCCTDLCSKNMRLLRIVWLFFGTDSVYNIYI